MIRCKALFILGLFFLGGCDQKKEMSLVPTSYNDLPGWHRDRHVEALPALMHTCNVIAKKPDSAKMLTRSDGQGTAADWKPVCKKLQQAKFTSHQDVKSFFEIHLTPHQISQGGDTFGMFTGYYVPVLKGSKRKHGPYQTPLYKKPGKAAWQKLSRAQIVRGGLKGKGLEIVWVDDPIDAFFVQIQGTGKVMMDTGEQLRINVSGQNGFPYFPIGKAMLEKGYLEKGNVSMQSIRRWLKEHPAQAESIMSLNESYVFFDVKPWSGDVIGSHNTPLTAHRSLAVDRSYIPLGTPLWLSAPHPFPGNAPLQQLMVAQDTGGAIKGAVRGDYYWGVGHHAAEHAGKMSSKGQMYVLLPR